MVATVLFFAVVIGINVAIETFRYRTRKRFVEEHLSARGLQLTRCRYSFQPFRWDNWNTHYRITALDPQGRSLEGTASATGFFRAKAWVDWD